MVGTLINTAAVLAGGAAGALLGRRFPPRLRETVMASLGLFTLFLGLRMAWQTLNPLILLGAVLLGGIAGELLDLDGKLGRVARAAERRLGRPTAVEGATAGTFGEGLVTASLIFLAGPMTIMGSIQDGLTGDASTLVVKSALDGFTSLALASTLGAGVTASAAVVFVVQGALTLSAAWVRPLLTEPLVREMTAAGGLLIFAIGLGLLGIRRPRATNLLPALVVAPLLALLASRL